MDAGSTAREPAGIDLQVTLLSERELTRLIRLTKAVAERLGVDESASPDLPELEQDIQPEQVLQRTEDASRQRPPGEQGGDGGAGERDRRGGP